ncbi:MAG: hypothetical protein ABII20_01605 [Candidatus Omnitrophota bacterium]
MKLIRIPFRYIFGRQEIFEKNTKRERKASGRTIISEGSKKFLPTGSVKK